MLRTQKLTDLTRTSCLVNSNINAEKYHEILDNHLLPVLAQRFIDKSFSR